MTAPADIEALAVLLEAATPGPWHMECSHADPSEQCHLVMDVLRDKYGDNSVSTDDHATAALIAALATLADRSQ